MKTRVPLRFVGPWSYEPAIDETDPSLQRLGRVEELTGIYNQARVFVAPTRFAAGIPHKVHEAAAHGVPVVATSLIAEQLGWRSEVELLVADSADEFAEQCARLHQDEVLWNRVRAAALAAVARDCSPRVFSTTLQRIVEETLAPDQRARQPQRNGAPQAA